VRPIKAAKSEEIEKINSYGKELIKLLDLETSPVGIALLAKDEEVPVGIKKIEKGLKHCQMVDLVRNTKTEFLAYLADQTCKGGAAALGLGHMPPKLASGEFYHEKLRHFKTRKASKKTLEKVPMLKAKSMQAVLYGPLETLRFKPDVVVIICSPMQIMLLTQALLYNEGGRLEVEFAGKQSICSDAVAKPYLSSKVGITVGCTGSRKFTEIKDSELTIGLPIAKLKGLMEGLRAIRA